MRKKRGLVSVVLATVMIVGSLTGCGTEKITAESLVSNAFGSEEVKSLDADVTLNLDMDVDASELTGSDTTMNIAIGLDCNVKSTEDVAYTDGKATVSFFGAKTKVDVKTYADIKEGVDSDETSSELSVEDNQTLAQIYLDTPFAYQEDIEGLLVNYYPNIKNLDNDTMISLMTFFNNYAADDFANYLDVYEYWSESEKKALALLYDLGIVDDDTLTSFDISKVDVQSYVDDYITPLK